jgi:pilus assembly protein CpaF
VKLSDRLAEADAPAAGAGSGARNGSARNGRRSPSRRADTSGGRAGAPNGHRPPAAASKPKARGQAQGLADLRTQLRDSVLAGIGHKLAAGDVDEADLREQLSQSLDEALRTSTVSVSPGQRSAFLDETLADMLGWGVLTPLMADQTVTEVMCNGHAEIWVERAGRIERTDLAFPSEAAFRHVITRMLATAGRRVDEASPMADGRLADGSRVNAVLPPLAVHGPVLTVRRFPEQLLTATDLITHESLSADAAVFVEAAVRGKLNILVSGGTGTGKTTFLNVLSGFIPEGERLVTIEDAAELRLTQPHVVPLEARPANIEGAGLVTIRDLVRNALRMRPDRIIVGEVRSGEAIDMLQAMNTGHEGSLTTVHANGVRDALSRIETMVLMSGVELPLGAIREQISRSIEVIVQLARYPDGHRVVERISEVQGREGDTILLQDIFSRRSRGPLASTGLRPACLDRLAERAVTVPSRLFRGQADTGMPGMESRASRTARLTGRKNR